MADQVIRNYKKPVGGFSKDSKADVAKAKFKQAQKEGKVEVLKNEVPFGPGGVAKAAVKIAKAVKEVKEAAAAKAAAKKLTAQNSIAVKPPTTANPPKPPTGSAPKKVDRVPERRDTAAVNKNPETPKKDKPMVLPGRGKFTGDLGRYNWSGK